MRNVIALSLADLRNFSRDPLLVFAACGPVLLALGIRFAVPWVDDAFLRELHIQLSDHRLFILSVLTILTPLILGMLAGFIILDERDARILQYLSVTPLSKGGYLAHRLLEPAILSFVFAFLALMVADPRGLHLPAVVPIMCIAALEAPMMALLMGAFADNKVEGLTLSKAGGLLLTGSVIAYFAHSPWQLLAGVLTPYWVTKAFVAAGTGASGHLGAVAPAYWVYITVGFLLHVALIYFLGRKFVRKVG